MKGSSIVAIWQAWRDCLDITYLSRYGRVGGLGGIGEPAESKRPRRKNEVILEEIDVSDQYLTTPARLFPLMLRQPES